MDVLVVDDDRVTRDVLVKALTRAGFMVAAAENGLTALSEIQQHQFRAVVLDIWRQWGGP